MPCNVDINATKRTDVGQLKSLCLEKISREWIDDDAMPGRLLMLSWCIFASFFSLVCDCGSRLVLFYLYGKSSVISNYSRYIANEKGITRLSVVVACRWNCFIDFDEHECCVMVVSIAINNNVRRNINFSYSSCWWFHIFFLFLLCWRNLWDFV